MEKDHNIVTKSDSEPPGSIDHEAETIANLNAGGEKKVKTKSPTEPLPDTLPCGLKRKHVLAALDEHEDGDMKLFVHIFRDKYLYDHSADKWFYWNDHYWREDIVKQVMVDVGKVVDAYIEERNCQSWEETLAKHAGDDKAATEHESNVKRLRERIKDLQMLRRKERVINLVKFGVDSLGTPGESWDSNPWILGCKNGVIDLRTGELRPGRPSDMVQTVAPVDYAGLNTPCQTWVDFLYDINDGQEDVVAYLQRLLGYGITGLATEAVHPVLWGARGRNGKTTILETLKSVLGDLAYKAPASFLLHNKAKDGESPDAVMMALRGRRIVWCSETNEGDRINPSKLKELSGDDTISARPPYGKRQIEFRPSHLLLLLTNKRPKIPPNDPALWQRIHLLPFKYSYIDKPDPTNPLERKADKGLKARLKKEAPAILAWLVRGCLKWQEHGLKPPACVVAATSEYQEHEDILGFFLSECCIKNPSARVEPKNFFQAYKTWCADSEQAVMGKKRFLEEMRDRFKMVKVGNIRCFDGVGVLGI